LVTLKPKLEGLVVPSKFYGVLAAGRPVLFVGARNGELAKLVQEIGCGLAVESGDVEMLMDRIMHLASNPKLCACMGFRGREAFEDRWSKDRAIEKWTKALNSIASLTPGQQPPPGS
jgi:colanic acid biosynthesis glycosyl transferase WcaI